MLTTFGSHLTQVHEELTAIGAYSAEARARRILAVSETTNIDWQLVINSLQQCPNGVRLFL